MTENWKNQSHFQYLDFMVNLLSYATLSVSIVSCLPLNHIRRSEGGLASKFASEIRVRAPNFASKNMGDKYPKLCPFSFRYNSKCSQNYDSFQTFASCGNRISQGFLLIWWTWLDLDPNFTSKLDVRSNRPPPPPHRPPNMEVPLGLELCELLTK